MANTAYQTQDSQKAEGWNRPREEAEGIAAALPPLLVSAERLASGVWLGVHALSAVLPMTSTGQVMFCAFFTPFARDSSKLHCESQLRSVQNRASPTGPMLTMRGSPR